MSLFEYDYDDLARQVQYGLERIGVNFLRAHGARMLRDLVDFHGYEQIDLELSHGGHTLKIHQVGRPRGYEEPPDAEPAPDREDEFESTFDGWPAVNTPPEEIARWLASLPVGEAPRERRRGEADPANPFAAERKPPVPTLEPEPSVNPFLGQRPSSGGPNPFAQGDRDRRRDELLRRLRGDEE